MRRARFYLGSSLCRSLVVPLGIIGLWGLFIGAVVGLKAVFGDLEHGWGSVAYTLLILAVSVVMIRSSSSST